MMLAENFPLLLAVSLALIGVSALAYIAFRKVLGRRIRWSSVVIVILVGYLPPIWAYVEKYRDDVRTVESETTVQGLATAYDAPNHGRYRFKYEVAGQAYEGWHYGNADCNAGEVRVGRAVNVFFDPAKPSKSELCSFQAQVKADRQIVLGLLTMMVLTAVLVGALRREKRKSRRSRLRVR